MSEAQVVFYASRKGTIVHRPHPYEEGKTACGLSSMGKILVDDPVLLKGWKLCPRCFRQRGEEEY